jgi:uncharacterized protein YukJ
VDVNDIIDQALTIDVTKDPQSLPYDNGSHELHSRNFWQPIDSNVTVYGFGFLFLPAKDGLHETHMNQGNPPGRHRRENGTFQDGAVLVQRGDDFIAIFTAFQTQYLPTDSRGFPTRNAAPLPELIDGSRRGALNH